MESNAKFPYRHAIVSVSAEKCQCQTEKKRANRAFILGPNFELFLLIICVLQVILRIVVSAAWGESVASRKWHTSGIKIIP